MGGMEEVFVNVGRIYIQMCIFFFGFVDLCASYLINKIFSKHLHRHYISMRVCQRFGGCLFKIIP